MKKFLLFAVSMCFSAVMLAEDAICIKPATIAAGSSETVMIYLSKDSYSNINGVQFDMYFDSSFKATTMKIDSKSELVPYDEDEDEYGLTKSLATIGTDGGHYRLSVLDGQNTQSILNDGNGVLATVKITVPEDCEPGIYPITIKAASLANKAGTSIDMPETISYIKVGAPTGASLKAEGVVPSCVTSALNEETAITSLDLSAATKINGTLDISSKGISALNTTPVTAEGIKYARTVTGNYATVCLPFAVSGTYYKVSNITSSSITLTEVTTGIPACTPAIVKGNISAETTSSVNLSAAVAGDNNLTGTYTDLADFNCCYLSGDKFHNDHATVAPYHAYLPYISGAKVLNVYVEDATGIHEITDQLSNEDIYTLQGIRVKNAQKGINIIGGKKVYNK